MFVLCVICGVAFEKRRHGPSKYCGAGCRRVFELREHHRKRKAEGLPHIGDTITCGRCGVETIRIGRATKYCPPCSMFKQAERTVTYRERHRQLMNDRNRDRQKQPRHNLDMRMKSAMRAALKGGKAGRSWKSFVDYTIDDLIAHIERQFLPKMSWKNMGRWHIDHIVPKSTFAYSSPDDADFRACWALTNLRPLWGRANIKKSAKRTHLL